MYWKLKVLTYLNSNLLIKLFIQDTKFFIKIIKKFFKEYYPIYERSIQFNNPILQYINLYPPMKILRTEHIPNKFEIARISNSILGLNSNRYLLLGDKNNNFIYSDKILPHQKNSAIPFSLGIVKNKKFKIITSNIFYFEVSIDKYNFRYADFNESLLIGFTNAETPETNNNFGFGKMFGLNVFENRVEIDGQFAYLPIEITKGDIVGIGLKYIKKFEYELFLTCNGQIINVKYNELNFLKIRHYLKVVICLNLASAIDVNFGSEQFLFDIEKINHFPMIVNVSKNNFVNNGFNLDKIESDSIYLRGYYSEYIYNLLNTNINSTL